MQKEEMAKKWGVYKGLQGKMLFSIKSLYKNVRTFYKTPGSIDRYMQYFRRCTTRPNNVSYVILDEFEIHFIGSKCTSIEIQIIYMFLIM